MPVKLNSTGGGSVTVDIGSTASNYTATLPSGTGTIAVQGVSSNIVSGTAVASTSGTSIDFTGIPSWVKRITVMFNGVSTSGASNWLIQLGDSGGIETTGYTSSSYIATTTGAAGANYTTGLGVFCDNAGYNLQGQVVISNFNSNTWVNSVMLGSGTNLTGMMIAGAGTKTLSATLDRIRITTVNGTDTFDAGTINILYE